MSLQELYRDDLIGNFNEFDLFRTNFARIQNVFAGNPIPPYEVLVHPSSTCNLRCLWCIGQNLDYESERAKNRLEEKLISPSNMLHILENILEYEVCAPYFENGKKKTKTFKTEKISFSGLVGEPLIAKNAVIQSMKYLVNRGIRTGIFTNGLLIDKEVSEVFANISYVLISLDAANNETYCKMKCVGLGDKYDYMKRVIDNILILQSEKEKIKSDLDINIGYVVNQYNFLEIELAARIAKSIGVRYFRLKMDIAVKNVLNNDQREIVKEQIENIKATLEDGYFKLVEIHSISKLVNSDQKRMFLQCYINRIFAAVASNGCLYACNYHAHPNGLMLGNLLTSDIRSIWESHRSTDLSLCPNVCDPYKNRANNMLFQAKNIYDSIGVDEFQALINNILDESVGGGLCRFVKHMLHPIEQTP